MDIKNKRTVFIPVNFQEEDGNKFRKQLLPYGSVFDPNQGNTFEIDDTLIDALIASFNEGIIEKVPLLLGTHNDMLMERTVGVVTGLDKDEDGMHFSTEITDEDTLTKINTKTEDGKRLYSGVSASFGVVSTEEGDRAVLFHVALTHKPVITGLSDFVALSFMVYEEHAVNNFEISLSERERMIRMAFYAQMEEKVGEDFYRWDYWIIEVFDNYVIVEDDDRIALSKYNFSIAENRQINFALTPIRVERQYIEIPEEENELNEQEILDALKALGIEIDSLDALKANLSTVSGLMTSLQVENADELTTALANIQKEQDSAKEKKKEQQREFDTVNKMLAERITVLENEKREGQADRAVELEIRAGKIAPAQKEHYKKLHIQSEELFKDLMKDQPVIIDTTEYGYGSGDDNIDGTGLMSNDEVEKEVERLLALDV